MSNIDKNEVETTKQIFREKPKSEDGKISGSTSYLQRKMQWGYNHAASIVEYLESEGWLSEPDHLGRRIVIGK